MRKDGRSAKYVFGQWDGKPELSAISYSVCYPFALAQPPLRLPLGRSWEIMIPEAFDEVRDFAGLITVLSFLVAFALSKPPVWE
jgi:ZIP family zinc transporter